MKLDHFMDLRVNIGSVLTLIGILLIVAGFDPPQMDRLHGLNVNLIWGIVTTVVGLFFLALYIGRKKERKTG